MEGWQDGNGGERQLLWHPPTPPPPLAPFFFFFFFSGPLLPGYFPLFSPFFLLMQSVRRRTRSIIIEKMSDGQPDGLGWSQGLLIGSVKPTCRVMKLTDIHWRSPPEEYQQFLKTSSVALEFTPGEQFEALELILAAFKHDKRTEKNTLLWCLVFSSRLQLHLQTRRRLRLSVSSSGRFYSTLIHQHKFSLCSWCSTFNIRVETLRSATKRFSENKFLCFFHTMENNHNSLHQLSSLEDRWSVCSCGKRVWQWF